MRSLLETLDKGAVDSLSLLLIEDNPADARLVEELLRESEGTIFNLETKARLKEGMALLRQSKFDTILIDLNLPDSTGLDTFLKLHSSLPRTPIIVLTGSNDEQLALMAIQKGAQDYLVKGDITGQGLRRSIRYAIERKHTENFMSALDQMTRETIGRVELQQVVNKLLGVLVNVLEADLAMVLLARGRRTFARDREETLESEWTAEDLDFVSRLFIRKLPVYVENVREMEDAPEIVRRQGPKSILGVPLLNGNEVVGFLLAGWSEVHPRNLREIRLLEVAAERFSVAIVNAQHLREIQELAKRVENERLLLSKVFESSSVGLCLVGPDNRVIMANEVWYRSTGYSPETAVGKDIVELFPEIRELTIFIHQKAREGEKVIVPLHSQHVNGEETWWEGAVTPVDIAGGRGTLISAIDVTERIAYERERDQLFSQIDAERLRLRTILDTLPIGIIVTDEKGKTQESNKIRDKIWGGSVPASKSRDYTRLEGWWADTGIKIEECPLMRALRYGETTVGAVIDILREDGTRGTVLVSAAPIKNPKGKLMGAVSVIQDITRQRQLEFDLLEAKSRAELYVDLLTHDVSNLNTAAMGYLQLLDERESLSEKGAKWVAKSLESLNESSKLIENVRKIQHIELEASTRGIIDIDLMLKDVVEEYIAHPDRNVEISLSSTGEHIVVGSELLRDVFSNLIGNAIKHSSGPVRIDIQVSSVFEKGVQYHRISVEDNGPGVPDEAKGRIFSRLQRGSTKVAGRGLGLYIVRRLVEDYQGRVWVEDRVNGDYSKGARFVVMLPASPMLTGSLDERME